MILLLSLFIIGLIIQVACYANRKKWLWAIPSIYFFVISIITIIFLTPFFEEVMEMGYLELRASGFNNAEINLISEIIKGVYFIILNIPTFISLFIWLIRWIVYRVKNRKNNLNDMGNSNQAIQENNNDTN